MRHVRGNQDNAARTYFSYFIADVESNATRHYVRDLLVRMAVGLRLVAWHKPVQRNRGAIAGERLLFDTLTDALPLDFTPVES